MLSERGVLNATVKLSPSSPDYDAARPNRVIGHALWQMPARTAGQTAAETLSIYRPEAIARWGWAEKMGLSEEQEAEVWSGTDCEAMDGVFRAWDEARWELMRGRGHW